MAHKYVFIDGEYLDVLYKSQIQEMIGNDGELSLEAIRQTYSPAFHRAYYYHALDDERREAETQEQFDGRLKSQEDRYDAIAALPGFHVRLDRSAERT